MCIRDSNAYSPRLVASLAAYVRPVRAQMLALSPVLPRRIAIPVYAHDGYVYLRQRPDGRIVLGGARHRHVEEEVGYEDATTEALQRDLDAFLRRHVPAAAGAAVEHRWSGTMGFSPDGLPVVTAVAGVPGAVAALGFTGHGMAYGLNVGRHLAAWAVTAADPTPGRVAGLEAFAASRPSLANAAEGPTR